MIRRTLTLLLVAGAATFAAAAPAAAHGQVVQPPSHSEPTVSGPISNAWARAHCESAAPGVVGEASNGVVTFSPAGPRPCTGVPNPGGQVHP